MDTPLFRGGRFAPFLQGFSLNQAEKLSPHQSQSVERSRSNMMTCEAFPLFYSKFYVDMVFQRSAF
jgi:hypothetical protein